MYLMDTPLNFDVILFMMKFFYHSQLLFVFFFC